MSRSRAAAIVSLVYAAGFGLPAIPVAVYFQQHGRLPSFFGLFDLYGGPWSDRLPRERFILLLVAFVPVTALVAASGWLLWRERRAGRALNLALLPLEAVFWIGFALPIPWVAGLARAVLVVSSWKVDDPGTDETARRPADPAPR